MSLSWTYRKLEEGEIPAIKLGNKWRVKRECLDEWLRRQNPYGASA
jgi:excisionase family DNA binding protein